MTLEGIDVMHSIIDVLLIVVLVLVVVRVLR